MGEIIVSEVSELTESQIDRINVILNEVPAPKPVEQKIIDLSKCINTIDMEFAGLIENWDIGKLSKIFGHNCSYYKLNGGSFNRCRVRQNHIHYYNGIGNPLPDGLLVTLYFYNDSNSPPVTCKSQDIVWNKLYNVSGYEVLEVLPEYKYGWEKKNE